MRIMSCASQECASATLRSHSVRRTPLTRTAAAVCLAARAQ